MTSDNQAIPKDDAIEALLEKAAPRPVPPEGVEQDVRSAVRAEWANVSGRRRRRRRNLNWAVAASVVVAVLFAVGNWRQTDVPMIEVARLDQSQGTVHFQTGNSAMTESLDSSQILTGQVLQTGKNSAAGLEWLAGGSLRVDAQTRIEFVSANEIFLHRGRVYFDSYGSTLSSSLAIQTVHGVVSHVGTQYMTETDDRRLVVSVREGQVLVAGANLTQSVHQGQRAELTSSSGPSITNTSGIGNDWAWLESVAPNISVDGATAYEFLQWVSRETGYRLEFSAPATEQLARSTLLKGTVNSDPRNELRMRMLTMDLDAQFDLDEAVITVTKLE